ncbi:MAG: peptidoglycan-binding protein [Actinomycetota bacterium]
MSEFGTDRGSVIGATGRVFAAIALVSVAAAAGFWAGRVVLLPPTDPLKGITEPITYTVAHGELERSLRFTATAEWQLIALARNAAAGVVTTTDLISGEVASAGQIICTVDLRPVVVAEGEIPAFRDMALTTAGADVAQLQRLLAELGLFTQDPDGVFGASTRAAVKAWQGTLGLTEDGVVRLGDVVFVPTLPARLALDASIVPGASLVGGEFLVWLVPDAPEFRVPLATEQRTLVPLDAHVRVRYREGEWEGRIDRVVEEPSMGLVHYVLTADDGSPLCGRNCSRWVDLNAPSDFDVEVIVVPHTVGPAVPVAAIHSDAGNQTYVVTADGSRVDITVLAASQGIAIVEGLAEGTVIVLPVEPPGD